MKKLKFPRLPRADNYKNVSFAVTVYSKPKILAGLKKFHLKMTTPCLQVVDWNMLFLFLINILLASVFQMMISSSYVASVFRSKYIRFASTLK